MLPLPALAPQTITTRIVFANFPLCTKHLMSHLALAPDVWLGDTYNSAIGIWNHSFSGRKPSERDKARFGWNGANDITKVTPSTHDQGHFHL